MASESNGTRWTLWWRGSSWQYYTFCFFGVLCFLLLISLTCFNTTLFKWLLIPFSTLSKLFPCKIRSNYIAHIEMIYCVKLSRLLWCLNSREWLKIQVVFWARLPIRGFMMRAVFKPQLWKLCSGVVPTDCPWAVQGMLSGTPGQEQVSVTRCFPNVMPLYVPPSFLLNLLHKPKS